MKRLALLFVCAICALTSLAQTPFFPLKQGLVLNYATKDGRGKLLSYTRYTITKVDAKDESNMTVGYQIEAFDRKMKQTLEPMDVSVAIADGCVTFDGTSSIGQLVKDMEIEGSDVIIPAKLEVGQSLGNYGVKAETLGLTSECTNVKVVGAESVAVGANTLECYKVDCDVFSKVLFIKTEGKSAAWYARGVGMVRSETYDKKGKLVSAVELIDMK